MQFEKRHKSEPVKSSKTSLWSDFAFALAASKSVSQLTSAEAKLAETKIIEQRRNSFVTSQVSATEAACASQPSQRKGGDPARENAGPSPEDHLICPETSLVISNILT